VGRWGASRRIRSDNGSEFISEALLGWLTAKGTERQGGGDMARKLLQRMFPMDQHHVMGLHAILGRLMPETGRILDLGCGANTALARYRSSGREVWGADFKAHSQLRFPEWFRPLGPGGSIPFPNDSFDLVVTIMVMEHIATPAPFFREVARVLRPGGCFVGHTISGSHYVTWLRRLVGLLPHSFNQWLVRKLYGRREEDTFPAFYRLNRRVQIEHACRLVGLSNPVLTRYAEPGYFRFFEPLQAAAIITDWLLERVASGWGRLYLTVMTRKEDSNTLFYPDTAGKQAA
jgi:SAM-dependent methyltransferase